MRIVLIALLVAVNVWADEVVPASIDHAYFSLYNLDFKGSQEEFSRWALENPTNPCGPASEAVGILFGELNRLGVLQMEFLTQDDRFSFKQQSQLVADPKVKAKFEIALQRAEVLAKARLLQNPKDVDALLAMPLSHGLRADYAVMIEKRNMAALGHLKRSTEWSQKLLAVQPDCYDAYLASGTSQYAIGSLFAPVRLLLRFAGYQGDKNKGITELKLTAAHGRYMAPYARILLAIVYMREQDKTLARQVLADLHRDFPNNTLVTNELDRLDGGGLAATK